MLPTYTSWDCGSACGAFKKYFSYKFGNLVWRFCIQSARVQASRGERSVRYGRFCGSQEAKYFVRSRKIGLCTMGDSISGKRVLTRQLVRQPFFLFVEYYNHCCNSFHGFRRYICSRHHGHCVCHEPTMYTENFLLNRNNGVCQFVTAL